VADGVDPAVDSVEPATSKANIHSTAGDPHGEQLPPRHETMLSPRKTSQRPIHAVPAGIRRAFTTHIVVNARFVDLHRGHATTVDDCDARVAR
jgi:hypothetical protein